MNTSTMTRDYHCTISVPVSAKEAFERISQVSDWWAQTLEGNSRNLGDEFKVTFGTTYVNFKITEVVPHSKIVWEVTDSYIPKLQDKQEWNNTLIVWDISSTGSSTKIDMTHVGLVPEVECYEMCESGWNRYAKDSLFKLITEHKGLPYQK